MVWFFLFCFFVLLVSGIFVIDIKSIKQLRKADIICNHSQIIPISVEEYTEINSERKALLLYLIHKQCGGWDTECADELYREVELFLREKR